MPYQKYELIELFKSYKQFAINNLQFCTEVQNWERWPSGRRHPLAKRTLTERWDGSSNLPLSVNHRRWQEQGYE